MYTIIYVYMAKYLEMSWWGSLEVQYIFYVFFCFKVPWSFNIPPMSPTSEVNMVIIGTWWAAPSCVCSTDSAEVLTQKIGLGTS